MNAKRKILFRTGAIALLLLIAVAMFIIGRGHTVYLDNKSIEYNGQTYTAPYKVVVFVDGEQVAKLYDKVRENRGMATCIGQKFSMLVELTETKGGEEKTTSITLRLPHSMDGIILNLPALLAGLPEEAYLSEFVIVPVEAEAEDEEIITDEFSLPEDVADAE
ncbi:MAG: DUF6672 family protein [Candidatus Pelethousia sp.]|nr:DUF6672 family protein [Candidatus Pelethousia sp.]